MLERILIWRLIFHFFLLRFKLEIWPSAEISCVSVIFFFTEFLKSIFVILWFVDFQHNKLFCSNTGGWNGKTHLNSGECYDPKTDKWTFISPALSARWDAGVAVDCEKLYLVGGCDRNAVCTLETECYNTENDSWSTVASLPVATHGLKCCTIQLPSKFVWELPIRGWVG